MYRVAAGKSKMARFGSIGFSGIQFRRLRINSIGLGLGSIDFEGGNIFGSEFDGRESGGIWIRMVALEYASEESLAAG